MNTSHTPGPWTYGYNGAYGYCITTRGGTHIATSILYKKDGGEANARLIAAAPELLSALQALCDAQQHGDVASWANEWDAAYAAISKATGEQA